MPDEIILQFSDKNARGTRHVGSIIEDRNPAEVDLICLILRMIKVAKSCNPTFVTPMDAITGVPLQCRAA